MEKDNNPEETYGNYKESSLSGESGKRKKEMVRISLKTYQNNLKKVALATAITVSLATGIGGLALQKNVTDTIALGSMERQFSSTVISPETHRTENNQYYYFDYSDIADRIESMDNPNLGYYLFYKNEGANQTDKVLQETRYRGFEEYLEALGYKDVDEYDKTMREIAILTYQIEEAKEGIKIIEEERNNIINTEGTYGGK